MYTIKFYWKDASILKSRTIDHEWMVEANIDLKVNTAGSFKFTLCPGNEVYDLVQEGITFVTVHSDTGKKLFYGRVYSVYKDFNTLKEVTCEGCMSYLNDSVFRPGDEPYQCTIKELVQAILDSHNSQVKDFQKIFMGEFDITGNVYREYKNYESSLSRISDLHESFGGYISIVEDENLTSKLNWIRDYNVNAVQTINFGENLLSLTSEHNLDNIITALIPLGADIDDEEGNSKPLTITSVTGKDYILADERAINEYGLIFGTHTWDDVTDPNHLVTKGTEYVQLHSIRKNIVNLTAIDMHLVDKNIPEWNIGDKIHVIARYHGLDERMLCIKLHIDIFNPENNTVSLGTDSEGYVSSGGSRMSSLSNSVEGLKSTLYADYIKTKRLDAEAANIGLLKADTIIADDISTKSLVAKTANIESIMAGNIGTGVLQSFHITGDNVVFDEAIIHDSVIADLSAGKITAGSLYTDLVQICDKEGHMVIDGTTIQIKDDKGTVRVQIGYDGKDYSLYLWDTNGTLLWQPTGITGDGIGSGTIKNVNVASNAAIDGTKLNIASVIESINKDGSKRIDAAKVVIDETTLNVAYKTIADKVSTIDTDFKVVQGDVSSKVWKTDINSAMTDAYSYVDQTAEGINIEVGNLKTSKLDESKVDGDYVVGKINLDSTSATIKASRINLVGAVTLNSLDTTAKAAIDNSMKSTITLYYRSTGTSYPSNPGQSYDPVNNYAKDNAWSTEMPNPKNGTKMFCCERYVSYNNTVSYSTVRELNALSYFNAWCSANNATYIDGASIYTGSITADQIAASAITSGKIAAGAITAGKIAAGAIKADDISAGTFSGHTIKLGGEKNGYGTLTVYNSSGQIEQIINYNGAEQYHSGKVMGKLGTNLYTSTGTYLAADIASDAAGFEITSRSTKKRMLITSHYRVEQIYSGTVYIVNSTNSATRARYNESGMAMWNTSGTNVAWINGDTGTYMFAGGSASTAEIKEDIIPAPSCLDKILDTDIYSFNYKFEKYDEDGEERDKSEYKKHYGAIIGEDYKCTDEIIVQNRAGIDTYTMTSIAWKAIQELNDKINDLEERLRIAEAKLAKEDV